MDSDPEAVIIINSSQQDAGFNRSKRERHMKTPSQLEALEKAFTGSFLFCMLYYNVYLWFLGFINYNGCIMVNGLNSQKVFDSGWDGSTCGEIGVIREPSTDVVLP